MQVHQQLSILFYRKRKKANTQGYIPIYCRVTISGAGKEEFSTSYKVLDSEWDDENKLVLPSNPQHKTYNKKISQMKTDLERHFDLVIAKNGYALPAEVIASYKTPVFGIQKQTEKKENTLFSLELDELIQKYVKYSRQVEKVEKEPIHRNIYLEKLKAEKQLLLDELQNLTGKAQKIYDNKSWVKTLLLATNYHILSFLQLVMADDKSYNTLKKLWSTKRRMLEFIQYRYKKEDIILDNLTYSFIGDFLKYCKITHKNDDNTLWKHGTLLKGFLNEAVSQRWISANIFATYECRYKEPQNKKWPFLDEMMYLIDFDLPKDLSDIRYIFVFQSFVGLSYAEIESLAPKHLITGIDGKVWIDQNRRKTSVEETLPLLPICLQILEIFKNDPRCLRKGRLLPVPTDQHYNRCLKKIAEKTGIFSLNNCHQARYVFVNEIAHPSGVDERTVGIMIGQKNPNSIRTYLKPNKRVISQNMQMVEDKLYKKGGVFYKEETDSIGKVVQMKFSSR